MNRLRAILTFAWAASALTVALLVAETPQDADAGLDLSATLANVAGAPDSIRFEILRWSNDAERDRLLGAWEGRPASDAAGKGGGGKGGAKAAKGKAAGKGAAKGAAAAGEPVIAPEIRLAAALQESATVGYVWSSELAGYALRYAGRVRAEDGTQRIVLMTQRRLGALNQRWTPAGPGTPSNYEFSVIELRLNAKGEGEGRASITGRVALDAAVRTVTLESYESLPVVFRDVRPAATKP